MPGFAFSFFAGKFTKPYLHKLSDKLTNEVSISTVELFIGFSHTEKLQQLVENDIGAELKRFAYCKPLVISNPELPNGLDSL
jgi:hypothetical protein